MKPEKTLITGASSGIGLELARQFAQHGHPMVLVAPVESELRDIARELEEEHNVPVQVIAKNLEDPNAAEGIYAEASRTDQPVDILVNNAGLGHYGKFWEVPMQDLIQMVRVNVEPMVRLTRLFLPEMVRREYGKILNTASVAGFEPGPLMAVYHATQAFVLSLSESLTNELKNQGVTVTALCPGITDTDFIPKAGMTGTKLFQKGNLMAPQEVAVKGYNALMRGDPIYVVGGLNKLQVAARRITSKSAQARMTRKMYEKLPMQKRKRKRGDVEMKARRKGVGKRV